MTRKTVKLLFLGFFTLMLTKSIYPVMHAFLPEKFRVVSTLISHYYGTENNEGEYPVEEAENCEGCEELTDNIPELNHLFRLRVAVKNHNADRPSALPLIFTDVPVPPPDPA